MTDTDRRIWVLNENQLKSILVRDIKAQVALHESQHKCAASWGVQQPTLSDIVNGKMERLTTKQLLGIAWKSGAAINISLNYAN